jgi:DNA primase large subunit
MNTNQIAELYARSPDFDPQKTMYQVEHITGRQGTSTEYNCPACAGMETNSLCINQDKICAFVNHPLTYYKKKKNYLLQNESKESQKKGEEKPPNQT